LALILALLDEKEEEVVVEEEKSNWNFVDNFQEVVNIKLLDLLVTLMVDMDEN
jgi:hypothetical protein